MNKRFIYFPSLSNGAAKDWLVKNIHFKNGTTSRFYDKSLPEKWQFPYFLLSAGHNYKHFDMRADMGLQDSFVIGDSGGYQIAMGALKWKPELKETIFNWLENNSDIAMNLDIPPRANYNNHFNEALAISKENFTWFEKNQTGKVKYLNVLQGDNPQIITSWYNGVKGYNFNGWSIGGTFGVGTALMYGIATLLENKEYENPNNQYLHILGVSSIIDFVTLAILQKMFNKKFDNRVTISTDSSSPNRATLYGTYYFDVNWKKSTWQSIYFGKNGKSNYNLDSGLPCRIECPSCAGSTYNDIAPYEQYAYMVMTNHNLYLYVDVMNAINRLIDAHPEQIKEVLSNDCYKLYMILDEMFNSTSPIDVYKKHEQFFEQLKNNETVKLDLDVVNEFFNF